MKILLLAILAFAVLPVSAQKDFSLRYADIITPENLKATLTIIAGAEMEGRATATPGEKKAAAFIEENFKRFGLLPPTPAGYQVPFAVYQDTIQEVVFNVNGKSFAYGQSFTFTKATTASGNYQVGEVVYVAEGDSITVSKMDLKGKWVAINTDSVTGSPLFRLRAMLRAKGVKGYLNISKNFPSKTSTLKGSMYVRTTTTTTTRTATSTTTITRSRSGATTTPTLTISYAVASAIFNTTITKASDLEKIAAGTFPATINFNLYKRAIRFESSNVVGVLPGTDKKDEYVILTAHYDHMGRDGNVIYYGADDDGSGTTSVIQMAEAFAKAKRKGHGPRRTIVFMAFSGEEQGLLGSESYSQNPLFPFDKTSVNLNTDMIGRIDPDKKEDSSNYVYTIGENKLSSDLKPITDSVRNKYSPLKIDRRFTIKDSLDFYRRSDHYNFAKNGVPVIFYFNGTHADYHRPTDTVDKINFDLMARRVKLIFHTAWIMANRDNMLTRDLPR